jgi:hypothetical protein
MRSGTLLLLLTFTAHAEVHEIPDHELMPGYLNSDVTQANVMQTVCVAGWTNSIRPSRAYIAKLKLDQMRELGQLGHPSEYHEDHVVPLCAGGHPTDRRNLWPQPLRSKWADKDKNDLEQSVCRMLCRGEITLQAAQAIFLAPDWRAEYELFFESPSDADSR